MNSHVCTNTVTCTHKKRENNLTMNETNHTFMKEKRNYQGRSFHSSDLKKAKDAKVRGGKVFDQPLGLSLMPTEITNISMGIDLRVAFDFTYIGKVNLV